MGDSIDWTGIPFAAALATMDLLERGFEVEIDANAGPRDRIIDVVAPGDEGPSLERVGFKWCGWPYCDIGFERWVLWRE